MNDIYEYSGPEIIAMLGKNFRIYRLQLRLTQAEVAAKAGLSVMTIHKFEKGLSKDLSISTLLRMMRAIGMLDNISALFPPIPESPYTLENDKKVNQRIRHKL